MYTLINKKQPQVDLFIEIRVRRFREEMNYVYSFYEVVVVNPLKYFYLKGPSFLFAWNGIPSTDICAQLTKVPAIHWSSSSSNQNECNQLIDREFQSYLVLFQTAMYFYFIAQIFYVICFKMILDRLVCRFLFFNKILCCYSQRNT
jgi:hypothetical protein